MAERSPSPASPAASGGDVPRGYVRLSVVYLDGTKDTPAYDVSVLDTGRRGPCFVFVPPTFRVFPLESCLVCFLAHTRTPALVVVSCVVRATSVKCTPAYVIATRVRM